METPGRPIIDPTDKLTKPLSVWRQLLVPVLVLAGLVILGRVAGSRWADIEAAVAQMGWHGIVVFGAAWVLLASCCFPVAVLGVSAGALFGFRVGLLVVFPTGMLAGLVMFILGRGLLRNRIRRLIAGRPRLLALDRMAGERALRMNVLTRLSPLNYGLACYTLAAGRTSLAAYLIGNLATIPSMAAQVWFGSLAGEAGSEPGGSTTRLVLIAVGLLFFLLLSWQITRMVRKALEQDLAEAGLSDPE